MLTDIHAGSEYKIQFIFLCQHSKSLNRWRRECMDSEQITCPLLSGNTVLSAAIDVFTRNLSRIQRRTSHYDAHRGHTNI